MILKRTKNDVVKTSFILVEDYPQKLWSKLRVFFYQIRTYSHLTGLNNEMIRCFKQLTITLSKHHLFWLKNYHKNTGQNYVFMTKYKRSHLTGLKKEIIFFFKDWLLRCQSTNYFGWRLTTKIMVKVTCFSPNTHAVSLPVWIMRWFLVLQITDYYVVRTLIIFVERLTTKNWLNWRVFD